MKTLFITFALIFALTALASPPHRVYVCHAQMIDCYGRSLYTYWAKGPQYQGACQFAANLCLRDAYYGYGGNGARCIILGK